MTAAHNRPLAAAGLHSFRYPSRYGGWIMIGAADVFDALREANRSLEPPDRATLDKLECWDAGAYRPAVVLDKPLKGATA